MNFVSLTHKHAFSYFLILTGILLWGYVLVFGFVAAQEDTSHHLHFVLDLKSPRIVSGEQIEVTPHKRYSWTSRVQITEGHGEFGFYIDEYDANGEWISGQWKGSVTGKTNQDFSYSYIPSSENVSFAAPQYYKDKDTSFEVEIDSSSIH